MTTIEQLFKLQMNTSKKCKNCHITYPFNINEIHNQYTNKDTKTCLICICINELNFEKAEFVTLFKEIFSNTLNIKKYKFIWKQSISFTEKESKFNNKDNIDVIHQYYSVLSNKLNTINEIKSKFDIDFINKCKSIFNSYELLLFYINLNDTNLEQIYSNILKHQRLYSLLKNPEKLFLFLNEFISNITNKDIIIATFLLNELNVMSLTMSMYRDIEYYNLKTIHYMNWFELGWTKSFQSIETNNLPKITSKLYKDMFKRLKSSNQLKVADCKHVLESDLLEMNTELCIFNDNRFCITNYYIYNLYVQFIRICLNSFKSKLFENIEELYNLGNEQCIEYEKWEMNIEQKQAIQFLLNNPLSFLIGEAGTGKTSVINAFCKSIISKYPQYKICILTPTGKATLRVKQILQIYQLHESIFVSTIHMFYKIYKDIDKPEYDCIIVDETSMFGLEHMKIFIDCFGKYSSRIIFVGDYQQLPSICGNDFLYQMKSSHSEYVTELKINQRVGQNKKLNDFLINIRNPDCYHFVDSNSYECINLISKYNSIDFIDNVKWISISEFREKMYEIYEPFLNVLSKNKLDEITFPVQTLYPKNINRFENNIYSDLMNDIRLFMLKSINNYLYENKYIENKPRIQLNHFNINEFQIGDCIVNKQNIYLEKIKVMNGLFGCIENIYTIVIHARLHIKLYKVRFEYSIIDEIGQEHKNIYYYHNMSNKYISKENEIKLKQYMIENLEKQFCDTIIQSNVQLFNKWYEKSNISNLQFSYITTVHKAQGSQWDTIIFCLDHKKGQKNNLSDIDKQIFYTGCSRTKNKLYIVYPDTVTNTNLKIRDQYVCPMSQSDYFGQLFTNVYKNDIQIQ